MEEIVNKVAQSGIVTLDLSTYYPQGERVRIDISPQLWQGLVLREKDFREYVRTHDWSQYQDKFVALTCNAEAIVPVWAYLLLASALQPYAARVVFGELPVLETVLFRDALSAIDPEAFRDVRVVVKGCAEVPVPESAYVELASILLPVVKSLMFGEACSTVPVYKRK